MRNVTVVVLDIKPIVTENCAYHLPTPLLLSMSLLLDNITYYQCDVAKWEEVEAVAKKVIEEVRRPHFRLFTSE